MSKPPASVEAYLAALPPDRRATVEALREVVRANLDPRLEEGIQYGMIGWYVPHSVYPAGYHCTPEQPLPYASVASQKSHVGLYLFCLYTDPAESARFAEEWKATGKRLDMGKSCVRVKKLEDVPLDVIASALRRMPLDTFLAQYEAGLSRTTTGRRAAKKAAKKSAKKSAKKAAKKATKKTARKATATTRRKRA